MSLHHMPNSDILERFLALQTCLADGDDWQSDPSWLRFAAQTAVLCAGEPEETAHRIRTGAEVLRSSAGSTGDLATAWRYVVAALLLQNGIEPTNFARELPFDHELLRAAGVRNGGRFETMAIAIMRHLALGERLGTSRVLKLQALYDGLKQHHWWLTGPDDLPACVEGMRRTERDYGSSTVLELAAGAPLVTDLVRFWTSDLALDIRRRAGLLP